MRRSQVPGCAEHTRARKADRPTEAYFGSSEPMRAIGCKLEAAIQSALDVEDDAVQ